MLKSTKNTKSHLVTAIEEKNIVKFLFVLYKGIIKLQNVKLIGKAKTHAVTIKCKQTFQLVKIERSNAGRK